MGMFVNRRDFSRAKMNSGYEPLPAGEYNVFIAKAQKMRWAGAGQKPVDMTGDNTPEDSQVFVKITFKVMTGEFTGRYHTINCNLWDEEGKRFDNDMSVFGELCKLSGVNPDTDNLTDLELKHFAITLKNNKDGKTDKNGNIYVNLVAIAFISDVEVSASKSEAQAEKEAAMDEDIPF